MVIQYSKSPIVEAVCEFRFDPKSSWSEKMAEDLYKIVKGDFPKREKIQQHSLEFRIDKKDKEPKQKFEVKDVAKFISEDGNFFVLVATNFLSVHHIRPYTAWTKYFPLIQKTFQGYVELVKPTEVKRIGLRYINQIVIQSAELPKNLKDYFNFYPEIGSYPNSGLQSALLGLIFDYNSGKERAKIMINDMPKKENGMTFNLDIDYFSTQPVRSMSAEIGKWLEEAHKNLEELFESSLTDKTKGLFL